MRRVALKRKLKRHEVPVRQGNAAYGGVLCGSGADECVVRHAQFFGVVGQYDFAANFVHPASGAAVEERRRQRVAGAVELRRVGVKTHRHELM